jgi:hypothetical protein
LLSQIRTIYLFHKFSLKNRSSIQIS